MSTNNDKLLREMLDLYTGLLIPFMQVKRDIYFPTDPSRAETDGEHSFTLAMLAITVAEKMKLGLDAGLIAKYSLIHDLVEAHAGDVSARSNEDDQLVKVDREHEAYLVIKERYQHSAPWIPELIERYESRQDAEAKFVCAFDKCAGGLNWLADNTDKLIEYYPQADRSEYHRVVGRLRKKASIYPEISEFFEAVHTALDKKIQQRLNKQA
jgi:5'-deoxynucleotidase YfbR-like HD superfamily hydrolase